MIKKFLLSSLLITLFSVNLFPGGWNTNTNNSAAFVRTGCRNASQEIDAAFFCPAGLINLEDGWHINFSDELLFINQEIKNDYIYMNKHKFIGEIVAPVYPCIYIAYKKDRTVISGGIYPYGAGGAGAYKTGMPSFEMQVANMVPELSYNLEQLDILKPLLGYKPSDISDYSADLAFYGASIKVGLQIDLTYKINNWLAASIGTKFIYDFGYTNGGLTNLMIHTPKGWMKPGDYLRAVNNDLGLIGRTAAAFGIADLNKSASEVDALTADKKLDVSESGFGWLPFCISFAITPNDKLNFGFKYQHGNRFEAKNNTKIDQTGSFPDGAMVRNDIPAYLAFGAQYKFSKKFSAQLMFEYYFERESYFGLIAPVIENDSIIYKVVDNSYITTSDPFLVGISGEYYITPKFMFSLGFMFSKLFPKDNIAPTERNPCADSWCVLGGIRYKFKKFDFDFGVMTNQQIYYKRDYKIAAPPGADTKYIDTREEYYGAVWMFGAGISYHFPHKNKDKAN